jgi:preprotein translocase subunit SecD
MQLETPLWKRLIIWAIVLAGLVMAAPNLFYERVETRNDAVIAVAKAAAAGNAVTPEQTAALSLWPSWAPSSLVNLGLDLRGGAHLLAEVKLADVYKQRMDVLWPDARDALKDVRDATGPIKKVASPDGTLRINISNPAGVPAALAKVQSLSSNVVTLTGAGQKDINVVADGQDLVITLSDAEKAATDSRTMQQSLEIIRRRVDAAGTREPSIQRQGADRILIEVPGVASAEDLKKIIGTTAKLTFNTVVGQGTDKAANPGPGNLLLPASDRPGLYYTVEEAPVVTGDNLVDAQPAFDQNGRPAVNFRFDTSGARKFGAYTAAHIGEPFAIVLDKQVISAPNIQSAITGGSGIMRAGALPATMSFLEERTVGPELGQDSIDAGKVAAIFGMCAVGLFMLASYGIFGLFADITLVLSMGVIFGILSMIGGTLTLPGIAGLVLTIGTAVDANVLVFERIREELRHVTTLITAIVLYFFGAGPVRGFAVALGIGIVTSVFAALYVTRLIVGIWFNWRKPKVLVV